MSSAGTILWSLPTCLTSFAMTNRRTIVMADVLEGTLLFLYLKEQIIRPIRVFQGFSFENVKLQFFLKRSLLCVINYNFKGAWVRYFNWKAIKKTNYDQVQAKQERGIWNRDSEIIKINQDSKVSWLEYRNEDYMKFCFYYLDYNLKGHSESLTVTLKNNLNKMMDTWIQQSSLFQDKITGLQILWEFNDREYLVKKQTVREVRDFQLRIAPETQELNNFLNFLNDNAMQVNQHPLNREVPKAKLNHIVTKTELAIMKKNGEHPGELFRPFQLMTGSNKSINLFELSQSQYLKFTQLKVRNYMGVFIMEKNQELKYVFINLQTKTILNIYHQDNVINNQLCFPDWNSEVVVLLLHKNMLQQGSWVNKREVKIIYEGLPPLKQTYLHLLLSLYEDFDDDLLQDAVLSLQQGQTS